MADVGSHHFVKSTDSVLVPQPSDDPADPLNWSPWWKFSAIFWATWVSFAQAMGPLALAPMFPALIKKYDSNLADVVQFTGVSILVLGFSNFLWVPLATAIGRRPVALASTALVFVSMIWRAQASSYNSFMGACALNGIAAGPGETLQPTIITDVFFLHERGRYNTLYFVFYFGALMVCDIFLIPNLSKELRWAPSSPVQCHRPSARRVSGGSMLL
jgi:MFS family permease